MNLENPKLVQNIMNILGKLPEKKGCVAGGSVANIIYSFLKKTKPVIKDIDIFFDAETDLEYAYLALKPKINPSQNYQILASIRYNNINLIPVFIPNKENFVSSIIHDFDFNCVQVGIDLKTKKMFYTDDFVNFLETERLKIVRFQNIQNTTVRLFNKVKDLNLSNQNLKEEVDFISNYLYFFKSEILTPNFLNFLKGTHCLKRIEMIKEEIEKYFFLIPELTDFKISGYKLLPKRSFNEHMFYKLPGYDIKSTIYKCLHDTSFFRYLFDYYNKIPSSYKDDYSVPIPIMNSPIVNPSRFESYR